MLQRLRTMTPRERLIFGLTLALGLACLVYYGFLESFLIEYNSVSDSLDKARKQLRSQEALISRGEQIDRRFAEVQDSLPQLKEGRSPESVFTEEISRLCRELGIRQPAIEPHEVEPVPDVPDFAYLILPLSRIEGDLAEITHVLHGFYTRNLIVRTLEIETLGTRRGQEQRLTLSGGVAQILRVQDLTEADQALLEQRRED